MEVASGFLVMAATLLEIKSRTLLPKEKPEEMFAGNDDIDNEQFEEDARIGLVEKLLEYKRFKLLAQALREMEKNASRIFTRASDLERHPEEILEISIGSIELLNIYHALLRRRISPPIHRVVLEKIGIIDRINEIRTPLKKLRGEVTFQHLVKKYSSRYETVISFMAVLEMAKTGELAFVQKANLEPIFLKFGRACEKHLDKYEEDKPDAYISSRHEESALTEAATGENNG